ncbi:MAG: HEAT repeat domain-containing protein [Candidatus Riflebacteria bacterium]|nr:HEAT repeat domain-containing protein [Candidatus Riflebacteria bacterium]
MADSLDQLLVDLETGTEEKRIKALQWIGYQMDPADGARVSGVVRRLASDPSPAIRYHARLALDEIERRTGVTRPAPAQQESEILELLAHEAPEVRLRGVLSGYAIRSEPLFEKLTQLLRDERDPWVRASLVKAVASYRRKVSLPLLVKALEDPDGRVRANTVEALATLDNPVISSRIAEMVDDPEHRVQSAVLTALSRDGGGDIRPRIETMLASGRVWLQASAVYVLQELMPPWSQELLEGFLKRGIEDRRLRTRVVNIIEVLSRRESKPPESGAA